MVTTLDKNTSFSLAFSGLVSDDLDFEYGSETTAYCGCAISLKGQFWYLGGYSSDKMTRQVIMNEKGFFSSIKYLEKHDYWL